MSVTLPSNLTDQQQRAIAAAIRAVPDQGWSDGMLRSIGARLEGDGPSPDAGPWDDATVNRTIFSVFADLGIDPPLLTNLRIADRHE